MNNKPNRKLNAGRFPAAFAVMLATVAIVLLSYLWLRGRCQTLGEELKALETRKADLERAYAVEAATWVNLKSPANMARLIEQHHLTMKWPSSEQIVRLEIPRTPELLSQAHWRDRAPVAVPEGFRE